MTGKLDQPIERKSPSTGTGSPNVWGVYEPDTGSIQYILADPQTNKAALIDVVWNFDPKSFSTDTRSMEQVRSIVQREGLDVEWVLDTHPHADHFMASTLLKRELGAKNAIGEKVREIAELWRDIYHLPEAFDVDGDFDRLFKDNETFMVGDLDVHVQLSPGHTLGSVTYVCGDAAFVHDTLMYPDSGTSRADFPGGSAEELWNSIQAILSLASSTRLFIGHDYGKGDRDYPAWEATVEEHLTDNIHVKRGTEREQWIKTRQERDSNLSLPDRMLAALQINLRAGQLPSRELDGRHYLKMPVDYF